MLRWRNSDNTVSTVLLFTDGEANRGPTTIEGIIKTINDDKKGDDDNIPTINTFGFGEDHDPKLLKESMIFLDKLRMEKEISNLIDF